MSPHQPSRLCSSPQRTVTLPLPSKEIEMTLVERVLEDTALLSVRYPRGLRVSRAGFNILAGLLSRGRPFPLADAACCTGPFGSRSCAANDCNADGSCGGNLQRCTPYLGVWSGTGCWSSTLCTGVTCCDCFCDTGTSQFYCYCHN